MSVENVKRFELGIALLCNEGKLIPDNKITREIRKKIIEVAILLEETALEHKDTDVLERAFDYFLKEEKDAALANGICETLENDIFQYFTWEQIFKVLKRKFKKLSKVNITRAVHFAGSCSIEYVKELVNTLLPSKKKEFLLELQGRCCEELAEDIKGVLKNM